MEATILKPVMPGTLAEFENWEPNDGYKYEWNDGQIIKFDGIKRKHLKLLKKLARLFLQTQAHSQGGELIYEQDVSLTSRQLRRPDLAFFSNAQIETSEEISEPIPEFVIEVISTNDQIILVKGKIKEYFNHGVKVVWLIFPDDKLVEVYTSYKNTTVCTDNDICSARPVLDDFDVTAAQLFDY